VLECANNVWVKSFNIKISSRKELIRLRALKIAQGQLASSMPAVPAIPHEELLPQPQNYCFSERMVRIIQREPVFGDLQSRFHQIYFVHDFALRNGCPELSARQLLGAFGSDIPHVKAVLDNGLTEPKFAVDISPLIMTPRCKFENGFRGKRKNVSQSRAQTLNTIVRSNIPVLFLEEGSILPFCDPERAIPSFERYWFWNTTRSSE
jgi:hypothetical protein